MTITQTTLDVFERTLIGSAVALAFITQGVVHEGFGCVLASGVFVALNVRLWRFIAVAARKCPQALPIVMLLKLPLLAGGVYGLLHLGAPWMVGLGVSNVFIGGIAVLLYTVAHGKAQSQRVH
ncbi:MAG: hypothetical protein NZT92_15495 [Abditibacteriales bacterium]|nr:hypothetical protein [Abditibacteriales bacterium]MDW8367338.1 hypothetical protein [Abditibacteriales bacterium]